MVVVALFRFQSGQFQLDGTSNIEVFWKNWDGDYVTRLSHLSLCQHQP
jgi:hypothetical protein